jgi:hypothetical protein
MQSEKLNTNPTVVGIEAASNSVLLRGARGNVTKQAAGTGGVKTHRPAWTHLVRNKVNAEIGQWMLIDSPWRCQKVLDPLRAYFV